MVKFFDFLYSKGGFWATLTDISGNAIGGDIDKLILLKNDIENQKEYLWKNLLRSELGKNQNFELNIKPNKNLKEKLSSKIFFPWGYNLCSQAFFTIVETIIRNLKHYLSCTDINDGKQDIVSEIEARKKALQNKICINIDFSEHEKNPNLYKICIWDGTTHKSDKSWKKVSDLINKKEIIEPISNEPKKCGISEMLICAAILRGMDYLNLDKIENPELITLDPENCHQLKYIFYMWKGEETRVIKNKDEIDKYETDLRDGRDIPYRIKFFLVQEEEGIKIDELKKIRCGYICKYIAQDHTGNNNNIWKISKNMIFDEHDKLKENHEDYIYENWVRHWLKLRDATVEHNNGEYEITVKYPNSERKIIITHGSNSKGKKGDVYIRYKTGNFSRRLKDWDKGKESKLSTKIYGIVESIETKILIVDERAYELLLNRTARNDNTALKEAQNMRLFVSSPKSYGELEETIGSINVPHFLVIHTSLLERICSKDVQSEKDPSEQLKRLLNKYCRNTFLFLTTGKSFPSWCEPMENFRKKIYKKSNTISWYDIQAVLNRSEEIFDETRNSQIYMIKEGLTNLLLNK